MELLSWNNTLAKLALKWSKLCVWEHPDKTKYPEYKNTGQNLYATTSKTLNLTAGTQAWYDEKTDYMYDTMYCVPGKMCGHYTQVVWATSRQIGCAYHKCETLKKADLKSAQFMVCQYWPPGNYRGQKPYTKGAACSKCESGEGWCKNKLCNNKCSTRSDDCPWKSCAVHCYNCAKLDEAKCRCVCADGWRGVDCSMPCEDTHDNCGANPGWPASWCKTKDYVLNQCHAMCKTCKVDSDAKAGQCPPVHGPAAYSAAAGFIGAQRATFVSAMMSIAVSLGSRINTEL